MTDKNQIPFKNTTVWVDQHGDFLFRFALLRVRDENIAEDLVQDTFLSALKAFNKFKGNSSERTWLTSIIRNKIIDYYRKTEHTDKMEGMDPSSDFQDDGNMKGRWIEERAPADWGSHPENAYEQTEFKKILKECIRALPKRLANIFTMKELDDQPSAEICKELAITSSNLWVMLHRARAQLRKCLELNWFESKTI